MTTRPAFDGIDLLLIDGNNLLHRLSGGADAGAVRLLISRLRGALPTELRAVLMLDGYPASGTSHRERVAPNLELRHAGSVAADDAIVELVREQPHVGRAAVVIVTDDRSLLDRVRTLGARTQRLAWLEAAIGGVAGSASGIGRRVKSVAREGPDPDADDRAPWKPGRGATRKRGNPRRRPRRAAG